MKAPENQQSNLILSEIIDLNQALEVLRIAEKQSVDVTIHAHQEEIRKIPGMDAIIGTTADGDKRKALVDLYLIPVREEYEQKKEMLLNITSTKLLEKLKNMDNDQKIQALDTIMKASGTNTTSQVLLRILKGLFLLTHPENK